MTLFDAERSATATLSDPARVPLVNSIFPILNIVTVNFKFFYQLLRMKLYDEILIIERKRKGCYN